MSADCISEYYYLMNSLVVVHEIFAKCHSHIICISAQSYYGHIGHVFLRFLYSSCIALLDSTNMLVSMFLMNLLPQIKQEKYSCKKSARSAVGNLLGVSAAASRNINNK